MRTLCCFLLLTTACSTVNGDPDLLKPTLEAFHSRARWKDYRGAAELLVPEKRDAFEKARKANHDDKDLAITDFSLEDAKIAPDRMSATAVSKVSWYRLPSASEQTATITTKMVWREQKWMVAWQDDGPFSAELAATDAGR